MVLRIMSLPSTSSAPVPDPCVFFGAVKEMNYSESRKRRRLSRHRFRTVPSLPSNDITHSSEHNAELHQNEPIPSGGTAVDNDYADAGDGRFAAEIPDATEEAEQDQYIGDLIVPKEQSINAMSNCCLLWSLLITSGSKKGDNGAVPVYSDYNRRRKVC